MRVTATVLKHARINVIAAPAAVVISESDVARGYVNVPVPTEISIQSNSPDGYALEFASTADFFQRARVDGLPVPLELGPLGGTAVAPGAGPQHATAIRLAYHFVLSPLARPGAYAWPIRLSVTPL